MAGHLQVYRRRERLLVALADAALRVLAPLVRHRPSSAATPVTPKRVLVLRLERIGDLLMAFEALASLRARLPEARIDLVVGSWNERLARAMGVADSVECLDAPWLARRGGRRSRRSLLAHALGWRKRGYELAINLEPDIRSNLLLACSRADRLVGYGSGGGGPVLSQAAVYDPGTHTSANASRLIRLALDGVPDAAGKTAAPEAAAHPQAPPRLRLSDADREQARHLLAPAAGLPCIGVHASGGRAIKEWHADRFSKVAAALGREYGATIVLTGTDDERELVGRVRARIPADVPVIDLCGSGDLLALAAVLERLLVFVTGDTGPMHLAAAVGTPVVAVFGPSDPTRYAPPIVNSRIVRIDLPCSPCNRIRHPPERCVGHVPDCLEGVTTGHVLSAARDLLGQRVTLGGVR